MFMGSIPRVTLSCIQQCLQSKPSDLLGFGPDQHFIGASAIPGTCKLSGAICIMTIPMAKPFQKPVRDLVLQWSFDRLNFALKTNLKLPHPRMHTRNFVLLPFFEIDRTWIHPLKKIDIKKLLSFIKESDLISVKLI